MTPTLDRVTERVPVKEPAKEPRWKNRWLCKSRGFKRCSVCGDRAFHEMGEEIIGHCRSFSAEAEAREHALRIAPFHPDSAYLGPIQVPA